MVKYGYDIKGYNSKKFYKSLTELRKDYMKSDVAKKFPNNWVMVYVSREDGTEDYVGMIATGHKYGIWQSVTGLKNSCPYYIIDKDGKLTKQSGVRYPAKYSPYMKTTHKSPVYATKVNKRYNIVTEKSVYLGEITFSSLQEGFIKAVRLFNQNSNKGIANPTFLYNGSVYDVTEIGEYSANGKTIWHLVLARAKSKWVKVNTAMGTIINKGGADYEDYVMTIPKSKVSSPDAMKYIEN